MLSMRFEKIKTRTKKYIREFQNQKKYQDNSNLSNTICKASTDNNIKIVQINVESLTKSKANIINKLFPDADILAIQETHVPEGETNRLRIDGFHMVNYIGHRRHGLATYINKKKVTSLDAVNVEGNEHTCGIYIGKLTIHNVYKPQVGAIGIASVQASFNIYWRL
jgi:exonuclease III